MSFKKIFSLALSLLTINSANLCVSAMEPKKPTTGKSEFTNKKSKAYLWGRFLFFGPKNSDKHKLDFFVDEDDSTDEPTFSLLDDDKYFVTCSICGKPLKSGEQCGILNCNGALTPKNPGETLRDLFMKNIRHSYHVKCMQRLDNPFIRLMCYTAQIDKNLNDPEKLEKIKNEFMKRTCPKCGTKTDPKSAYYFEFSTTEIL